MNVAASPACRGCHGFAWAALLPVFGLVAREGRRELWPGCISGEEEEVPRLGGLGEGEVLDLLSLAVL